MNELLREILYTAGGLVAIAILAYFVAQVMGGVG